MKLIPEARRWYRMLSVWAWLALLAWIATPDADKAQLLSLLPGMTADRVLAGLALSGLVGRFIAQPRVRR